MLGVMVLAAGGVLASAGSASAIVEPPAGGWDHTWSAYGATVYVEEHDDIISLCDSSANGHAATARVEWLYPSGNAYWMVPAKGGNGTCSTQKASTGANLPEGETIYLEFSGDGTNYRKVSFFNDH
ncbi:hypothetical protein [Amycolatopsis thermophila]|uniref:Secreted protein n=1 Tax=Amycolatopsis thermophila TaxID=206084 RepID=A0ABU0ERA8_9PSEU|nr:hypothetical protein [Amycolatopsis thermophila]MDQ0377819.1 hypothetical protein [Amycolatopsis thermophila]